MQNDRNPISAIARRLASCSVILLVILSSLSSYSTPRVNGAVTHPVSVVEADVYVDKTRTTMKLTCFAEDLELLQGIEALESGIYDSEEIVDAMQDHADYLAERIEILDIHGEPLSARVTEIIDFEIPDEGIKAGQLMQYVMGFVLEYEYETAPQFLTFRQNMVADGALLPSELKILLKQAGSETPYTHMMKPGMPETFRFDWESPLLAPDADPAEWENWFEEQREKTLGIDSYSSTYSFIYINDHAVRHEVLIPLATLAALIDFQQADKSFLDIPEQKIAAEQIKAWFSAGNPVRIDENIVEPEFDRIDFYGLNLRDFAMRSKARKVSMASGRVGVIMCYPAQTPPQKVEVTWDMFNHAIRSVDSVIVAYDETRTTAFSKFLADNTFTWTASVKRAIPAIEPVLAVIDPSWLRPPVTKIPLHFLLLALAVVLWPLSWLASFDWKSTAMASVIALLTAGVLWKTSEAQQDFSFNIPARGVTEIEVPADQGEAIFDKIHTNLFRAFEYRDPSDVYDALAHSVDGPLLRELYLDVQRTLKMREQGGAVAEIEEIETVISEPSKVLAGVTRARTSEGESTAAAVLENRPTFGWRCKWNLSGTVEHWGHIHQRINQYDAKFNITDCEGVWKITRLQMTDNQGTVKTSRRKLETER